jgi:hypothetical protein
MLDSAGVYPKIIMFGLLGLSLVLNVVSYYLDRLYFGGKPIGHLNC